LNTRIGYKVVRRMSDGSLMSLFTHSDEGIGVDYRVGRRTVPKVKGSLLLAFDSVASADRFISCTLVAGSDYSIYKARLYNSRKITLIILLREKLSLMSEFWSALRVGKIAHGVVHEIATSAPEGTLGCTAITLLEMEEHDKVHPNQSSSI